MFGYIVVIPDCPSNRTYVMKLYLHLKAQTDSIGHVLRRCNEVLEFSFCFLDKQGSNNDVLWASLVMTFVNYLLRIQNHWVNLNQIWNKLFQEKCIHKNGKMHLSSIRNFSTYCWNIFYLKVHEKCFFWCEFLIGSAPSFLSTPTSHTITDDSPLGYTVLTVTATDVDPGDSVSVSLTSIVPSSSSYFFNETTGKKFIHSNAFSFVYTVE